MVANCLARRAKALCIAARFAALELFLEWLHCKQRKERTMNNAGPNRDDYGRLIAQAKVRAAALRREAIDDFWSGMGSAANRALRHAGRRCQGLLQRLRRRTSIGEAQ